ncbi:MAG: gliding motility-associated-like protein, partial [Bacteroidia bacterium]
LNEDFEILADLYVGNYDPGADGIVFAFQQQSVNAGTSGGGMGIQGVQPSLFVPFDTYQNGSDADPSFDHVSINENGNTQHNSVNNLAGPVQASATSANIEDGANHLVLIRWLVDSTANTQTLEVYFDCVLRVTATGNFISSIFNNNPNVFWGFTAATGGLNNEHSFCFNYVSALATNLGDQTTCIGESVQIAAPPIGSSYSWTPATGLSNPNIENPIATPDSTTTYVVSISNICNNIVQDSLTVFVLDTNHTHLEDSICEGESYFAQGALQTTSGTYIDTLVNQDGCDSVIILDLIVLDTSQTFLNVSICENTNYDFNGSLINTSGTYIDTLLNRNGCDSVITLQLSILSTDTSYSDTTLCSGFSFLWNSQNVSTAGVYNASFTNNQGCDSTLYLTVTVDLASSQADVITICTGDSVFLSNNWQGTSGVYIDTFQYQGSQCDSIIRTSTLAVLPVVFTYLDTFVCARESLVFNNELITSAGIYLDTIFSPGNCDEIIEWNVTLRELPLVEITGSSTFCIEDGGELTGFSDFSNINWLPFNSSENPIVISNSDLYILETIDTSACIGRDSMLVTALENCYLLMLPTAFSPNQDGINDIFGPINRPEEYYVLDIYNRFGELIFHSEDPNIAWDGTYKGKTLEIGIYSFNTEYQFKPNHEVKYLQGSFTLIR